MRSTFLGLAILVLFAGCAKSEKTTSERTDLADPASIAQHLSGDWLLVQRQEFRIGGQQTKDIDSSNSVIYQFKDETLAQTDTRFMRATAPTSGYSLVGGEVIGKDDRPDGMAEHWFSILSVDAKQLRIEYSERGRMAANTKLILVFNRLAPETRAKLEEQAGAHLAREVEYPEAVEAPRVSEPQAPVPTSTVKAPTEFLDAGSLLVQGGWIAASQYVVAGRVFKVGSPLQLNLVERLRYDKKLEYSVVAARNEKGESLSGSVDEIKASPGSYCFLGSDDLANKPSSVLPQGTLLQVQTAEFIRSITANGDLFRVSLTLVGHPSAKKLECRIGNVENASDLELATLVRFLSNELLFQSPSESGATNPRPTATAADSLKAGTAIKFVNPLQVLTNQYSSHATASSYFSNGKNYSSSTDKDYRYPYCDVAFESTPKARQNPTVIEKPQIISGIETIVRWGGFDSGTRLAIYFADGSAIKSLKCSLGEGEGLISWDDFLRTLGENVVIHPVQ